jgi:hypothetical protein
MISMDQWQKFDKDFNQTKKYNGQRYGQAFCNCFNIRNDFNQLYNENDRTKALAFIMNNYIQMN